jgi:hypothetical protein
LKSGLPPEYGIREVGLMHPPRRVKPRIPIELCQVEPGVVIKLNCAEDRGLTEMSPPEVRLPSEVGVTEPGIPREEATVEGGITTELRTSKAADFIKPRFSERCRYTKACLLKPSVLAESCFVEPCVRAELGLLKPRLTTELSPKKRNRPLEAGALERGISKKLRPPEISIEHAASGKVEVNKNSTEQIYTKTVPVTITEISRPISAGVIRDLQVPGQKPLSGQPNLEFLLACIVFIHILPAIIGNLLLL